MKSPLPAAFLLDCAVCRNRGLNDGTALSFMRCMVVLSRGMAALSMKESAPRVRRMLRHNISYVFRVLAGAMGCHAGVCAAACMSPLATMSGCRAAQGRATLCGSCRAVRHMGRLCAVRTGCGCIAAPRLPAISLFPFAHAACAERVTPVSRKALRICASAHVPLPAVLRRKGRHFLQLLSYGTTT